MCSTHSGHKEKSGVRKPVNGSACCRAVLLRRFLDGNASDPYEHTALVLTNITRLAQGRKLLLEPGRGTLQALASQLRSASRMRRSGCANALRNCFFRAEVGLSCPLCLPCCIHLAGFAAAMETLSDGNFNMQICREV